MSPMSWVFLEAAGHGVDDALGATDDAQRIEREPLGGEIHVAHDATHLQETVATTSRDATAMCAW